MSKSEFLFRDDDVNVRNSAGKIVKDLGFKPLLVDTLKQLEDSWHNELIGAATDWQILNQGDTTGADDIIKLSEDLDFNRPIALLTNQTDVSELIKQYGEGPTGKFYSIFNKEDAFINGDFKNFIRECSVYDSPLEEKIKVYHQRLVETGLDIKSTNLLISENDISFPYNEQMSVFNTVKTVGEMCDIQFIGNLIPDSQKMILARFSNLLKHTELNFQTTNI